MRGAGRGGPVWKMPKRMGGRKSIPLRAPTGRWCGPLPTGVPAIQGLHSGEPRGSAKGSSGAQKTIRTGRPRHNLATVKGAKALSRERGRWLSQTCRGTRGSQPRPQGSGETMPGSKRYAAVEGSGKTIQPVGPRVRRNDSLLTRGPRKWGWGLNSRTEGGEKTAAISYFIWSDSSECTS